MTDKLIDMSKDLAKISEYQYADEYLEEKDRAPKPPVAKNTTDGEFDHYSGVVQPSSDVEQQLLPVVTKSKFLRSQWQFWVR